MTQISMEIKTSDKFIIYGTLDRTEGDDVLIIFVHGFTGSQREHQYFNAAPFFNNNGFSTFRFDLYNNKKDARKISEASFTNHIEDLNYESFNWF